MTQPTVNCPSPSCCREWPSHYRVCPECGTPLPRAVPSVLQAHDSVVRVGEVIGTKIIHEAPDPSARSQATLTGVPCAICGRIVVGSDWFQCAKCGRRHLHTEHQDARTFWCRDCARAHMAGEPCVGEVLGQRYAIRRLIGRGGMGAVYLAHDQVLDREFALKCLPAEIGTDAAAVAAITREAATLMSLGHENIVRVYDLLVIDGMRLLKLEYVDGLNLAQVLEASAGRPLAHEELLRVCEGIVRGLEYLHGRGIVHRDVKPANVLLAADRTAKITDFGLARTVHEARSRLTNQPSAGTLFYMSPQQLRGRPPEPSDDIYALGVTVYEMLAGKPPFHSGPVFDQILHLAPDPLPVAPAPVAAAVMRALAKEPGGRWPSVGEFLAALRGGGVDPAPSSYREDAGVGLGLEMLWVEGGTFLMGSPAGEVGRDSDEGPQREVVLDGFWLGKHAVTQGQYEALMGTNPSRFKGDGRLPVESVRWTDAMEFCRRLSERTGRGYTLPTEAQWEYACRAGSAGRYCFGDSDSGLDAYAWYAGNSEGKPHPVGTKRSNAWGLHDMHGNVWEWCRDWFADDFYGSSAARVRNPENTTEGSNRVFRGGSWNYSPQGCRSANRLRLTPGYSRGNLGFRVLAVRSGIQ